MITRAFSCDDFRFHNTGLQSQSCASASARDNALFHASCELNSEAILGSVLIGSYLRIHGSGAPANLGAGVADKSRLPSGSAPVG